MKCKAGMSLGMLTVIFLLSSSVACLFISENSSGTYNNLNQDFNTETKVLTVTCFRDIICDIEDNPDTPLNSAKSIKFSEGSTSSKNIRPNLKNLESVNTSNSVRNIGGHTFAYCDTVRAVTIPNSVKNIGSHAFIYCTALESVTIPNSVKTISDYAFAYCTALESVTIPNSVKNIGSHAFFGCRKLKFVTIPNSVKTISDYAFAECYELESVTIPNSVKNIGSHAFFGCRKLKFVTIPNSVKIIEETSNLCPNTAFDIIYKLDGGNTDNPTTYTDKGLVLKDATKKDCKFIGWFTDSRFEKQVQSIPVNSYGNITLYAKFEPSDTRSDNIKKDVVITDKRDSV